MSISRRRLCEHYSEQQFLLYRISRLRRKVEDFASYVPSLRREASRILTWDENDAVAWYLHQEERRNRREKPAAKDEGGSITNGE